MHAARQGTNAPERSKPDRVAHSKMLVSRATETEDIHRVLGASSPIRESCHEHVRPDACKTVESGKQAVNSMGLRPGLIV